jgi:hypothetical protein
MARLRHFVLIVDDAYLTKYAPSPYLDPKLDSGPRSATVRISPAAWNHPTNDSTPDLPMRPVCDLQGASSWSTSVSAPPA